MAQVKPSLTLDINVGPSSSLGIGGSSTSNTPRSRQNAINSKTQQQFRASAQPPDHRYSSDRAYNTEPSQDIEFNSFEDNDGFSSDDNGPEAYATAQMRLRAGSGSAGARATRDSVHNGTSQRHVQQQQQRREFTRYQGDDSDSSVEIDKYGSHHRADSLHDEMMYDDENEEPEEEEEEEDDDDDDDDLSSSPSIPDENIDFDLVYALHNFIATVEGQATVHKGNSLTLLDDSNSYWWLVRVLRTQEVGYIPAENIETPFERLARLNKHRNVDLTSATDEDHVQVLERIWTSHLIKSRHATGNAGLSKHSGKLSALSRRALGAPAPFTKEQKRNKQGVIFGPSTYLEHSGDEYSSEGEYDEDTIMEMGEDGEEYEEDEMGSDEEDQHNAFARMEPDDGMEWDAAEAERIQREQEAQNASQSRADQQNEQQRSEDSDYSRDAQAQQAAQKSRVGAGMAGVGAAGAAAAVQRASQTPASLQPGQGRGPSAGSSLNPAAAERQTLQQPGPSGQQRNGHIRTTSAERSISSISSAGLTADQPGGVRTSTSSANGFLPSQLQAQREPSASDASANSGAPLTDVSSITSPDAKAEKRKSNRRSKAEEEEKAAKKRSGVFSLFTRSKDKKERKSGSFGGSEDRDSILTGRSSEDSFASPYRGRQTPPANARFAPGQSMGMGRAVQERDRAQQEAYQKQFLSGSSGQDPNTLRSSGDQSGLLSARPAKPTRPGSLVGPSGSTPMLSVLRVFAGQGVQSDSTFKTVLLNDSTQSTDLLRQALQRFGVPQHERDSYVLTLKRLEGDERPLDEDEHPLQLFNTLTEILSEGQVTVPSIKRSSVGSISSISSNLSMHPAIARLGNDFSDDHAVKFYISRKDQLDEYAENTPRAAGDSWNTSDVNTSQYFSNATGLSLTKDGVQSSTSSVISSETTDTIQGPTARFALRLVIFPSDLPEGLVFDPQTNAMIPRHTLDGRAQQYREPAEGISLKLREKVLTFPRNTTVAEVVEAGLDRFGIAEGVVEGGDDVEDRPSRRKSRLHVKYGLAVQDPSGEWPLAPKSKILDAYTSPPTFKTGFGGGKRRSVDSAMLLSQYDDVGPNDPTFILRQVQPTRKSTTARALSPTDELLQAKQDATRQNESQSLTNAETPAAGMSRQEIITAQRAAVLGAQRNAEEGVDLVLADKARIRSSKLGDKFRYSYLPVDGQERDISHIIKDVLTNKKVRPPFAPKSSELTLEDYESARSSPGGAASPLSLNEVHYDMEPTAPLSFKKSAKGGDLLDTFVRNPNMSESVIDDRIDQVLNRVRGHKKQISNGSELSNSRDTASPLTIGTSSAATHTTMPTPMSTLLAGGTFRAPTDLGLDHLYTIVDAAARRDPKKARLLTHGSLTTDANGRLATQLLADNEHELLRPEAGGLFAPQMPFVENRKTREAYVSISSTLGTIDETLDQLLFDAMRFF